MLFKVECFTGKRTHYTFTIEADGERAAVQRLIHEGIWEDVRRFEKLMANGNWNVVNLDLLQPFAKAA